MKSNLTQLFSLLLFIFSLNIIGQTQAVTVEGDTIYVYNNGAWSYELLDEMPIINEFEYLEAELAIDTIQTPFQFSDKTNKEVINASGQFRIKYDGKAWKRVPAVTLNEEAEFGFESKSSDIWCVVISEETPIETTMLFKIAKKTLEENSGAEAKIIKTELITVNGAEVLRGVMNISFSGISFIFDSYYFSNEKGSVQFTTWTSAEVWKRNENEIQDFLHGFVVD
ncbi:hypothetical protein RXV94_06280 [Yeosuana sp. MJ-SS3]|uniref:Uncharacterized protein n=1 Tax=Gilvirhabdus luticola TaxID=3079858 RepID=A0ABU3U5T6_9FLAO|nr:hypothetical protein [Yeosuana sp. MJ-SS3]MDU8885760.1 hypothetical protein [Yeosuana sp. MJ-SS3]